MSKVVASGIKYNTQFAKKRFTKNNAVFAQSRWEQTGTHSAFDDFNCSSYTDNGTGLTTVNYTTARVDIWMPDVVKNQYAHCRQGLVSRTTSACDMQSAGNGYTSADSEPCCVVGWGYAA